jgi:hypothetical protein
VSWVTPTPGCTAKFNFLGNRYSQPLILHLFGRSGQELLVEYQVEPFSINFSMSIDKKGCTRLDRGQHLGTVCIRGSLVKERFHSDSTSTKIIGKSHTKNPTFYVFTPWLILFLQESRKVGTGIFHDKKNWRSYKLQRGRKSSLWIVTTIKYFFVWSTHPTFLGRSS